MTFIQERTYRYAINLIANNNLDNPIFKCIQGHYDLSDKIITDKETLSCTFSLVMPLENNSKLSIMYDGKGEGEFGPLFFIHPASTYFGLLKLSE